MPENIIPIYKNVGETPLEVINRFKKDYTKYTHMPMTYAGRLDPLVEGLLLLLAGDECMKKDDFLALSKTYEVSILFGFTTDTSDLLGLVESQSNELKSDISNIENILPNFTGKIMQKYPQYSSRTVEGKALFQWAREGKIDKINIPTHEVIVHEIKLIGMSEVSGRELLSKIEIVVPLVKGDFRQGKILSLWREILKDKIDETFQIAKIIVTAGSGTYMRVLAHDIGKALNIPALAYHIKRTKIGEYNIDNIQN